MFQAVKPEEIFDYSYWQVPETHPAYWLAQLRRKEWIRLLFLLSLKPASRANKPVLAGQALERLEFKVCESWLEAYQVWKAHPGSIIIQFRHSYTDWTRGIPEILPPDKADRLGVVNIASRLACKVRKN
jgi:hypothetical protein